MVALPVADLHCDLLTYLATKQGRDVTHFESHCSRPQIRAGNVLLQVMAVFTETKRGSSAQAAKQFAIYNQLINKEFVHLKEFSFPQEDKIFILAALENASGICEEEEDLDFAFARLNRYSKESGPILYISLTHNEENRFGGGNMTTQGLKDDGRTLLEFLSGQGIAIDLSHTSDHLAYDILNHIDKKNLDIIPIASHSNFRAINVHKRNLTDEIATEIGKREGLIGLNFMRTLVGDSFIPHLEHARTLDLIKHMCFGADFFFEGDVIPGLKYIHQLFFEDYADASCYPRLLKHFSKVLSPDELVGIAYKNVSRFLERIKT